MKYAILAALMFFSVSTALWAAEDVKFSVKFENTSDKKMYYYLYWIDHPFDWPGPANMAGGELQAHQSIKLDSDYPVGKFIVIWRNPEASDDKKEIVAVFEVKRSGLVTIRPEYVTDQSKILWQVSDQFHLSNSLNDCLTQHVYGCKSDSQCAVLAEKFCGCLLPDGCWFGSFGVEC